MAINEIVDNEGELLDYYTFDNDKHMYSGRSGKQRSKKEVAVHTNRTDPSGHSRKLITKMRNTERNHAHDGPVTVAHGPVVPEDETKKSKADTKDAAFWASI